MTTPYIPPGLIIHASATLGDQDPPVITEAVNVLSAVRLGPGEIQINLAEPIALDQRTLQLTIISSADPLYINTEGSEATQSSFVALCFEDGGALMDAAWSFIMFRTRLA